MQQQPPMGYGQGMYGAYGPPANVMAYPQQPGYAMRPAYVAAPSPYGPGYVDAGDGRPAMVFGGAYEGVSAAGAGYRSAYQQPVYQTQPGYPQAAYPPAGQVQAFPPQGYAAAPAPAYPQAYPATAQPAYAQPSQPAPQYAAATQTPQPAPQYAPAIQQAQPQYPPASQPAAQPAYQQPAPQYPQGTQAPAPTAAQAAYQYSPASQPSPSPQPQYPPTSQPAAQTTYQQASPQYPQGTQPATQQPASQYPAVSQPSPQPQYLPVSQPNAQPAAQPPSPQPGCAQTPVVVDRTAFSAAARSDDPRSGFAALGLPVVAAVGGAAAGLGYSAYERHQQAFRQNQNPAHLNSQDTIVQFEPWSKNVDTHHHALKALSHSSHSVSELSAIIGTYLAAKHVSEIMGHGYGISASRPEVKEYYHMMDKLEKLSADYVGKHKSSVNSWKEAVGPHRRQIFSQLYNKNELVRAFCQEMEGGPLALPELDSYSLGTKITSFSFARSAVRQANLRASLSVLAQVRTVILVDDSYSMNEPGHRSWGLIGNSVDTRWNQARNLLAGIAPLVAAENTHGMDLHFLNRVPFYAGLRTAQAVQSAFDSDAPNNGTPTGARVNDILDAYVATLRYYRRLLPLNLIVITDGEAQDEELLHQAIEHHVTELVHHGFPAHQFGVEFVQVGDCQHATRHLEKLEKEVSRHHHRFQRDVVGVTPANRISNMDPEGMLAIAVSGVDARMNGYMRSRGVNV